MAPAPQLLPLLANDFQYDIGLPLATSREGQRADPNPQSTVLNKHLREQSRVQVGLPGADGAYRDPCGAIVTEYCL